MFEGERARGRVLAAQDRPGQRDRAVSSPGGTSELRTMITPVRWRPRSETIWIYSGIKLHFQQLLIHSFPSVTCRVSTVSTLYIQCEIRGGSQIFGETLPEAKTLFHTWEVHFNTSIIPYTLIDMLIHMFRFESRVKNSYVTWILVLAKSVQTKIFK